MDQTTLVSRIGRGNGIAARVLGVSYDVFRPRGALNPMVSANRLFRLQASFNVQEMNYRRPQTYGPALFYGIFDQRRTQPGDYLSGPGGVFFIASQLPLLPVLCVLTNRTLSFARPAAASAAGTNTYGGVTLGTASTLASNWPASVLEGGGGSQGLLPEDASVPGWTILLPAAPVTLRSADLVTDDTGRTFVISSAEQSALGWRLAVAQAAT